MFPPETDRAAGPAHDGNSEQAYFFGIPATIVDGAVEVAFVAVVNKGTSKECYHGAAWKNGRWITAEISASALRRFKKQSDHRSPHTESGSQAVGGARTGDEE